MRRHVCAAFLTLFCLSLLGPLAALGEESEQTEAPSYLDQLFPGGTVNGDDDSTDETDEEAVPEADQDAAPDNDPRVIFLDDFDGSGDVYADPFQEQQPLAQQNLPSLPPVRTRPTPRAGQQPGGTGGPQSLDGLTGISFQEVPLLQVIETFNNYLGTDYIVEVAKDGIDPQIPVTYEYQAFRELTREELREIFDDFLRNVDSDEGFRLAVERRGGEEYIRQAFSFGAEGLPLPQFIYNIAEILEINYILDPAAGGNQQVTLVTHKNVFLTKNQLWDVFYTVLNLNGLSVYEEGTYWQIVPTAEMQRKGVDIQYPDELLYDLNLTEAFQEINRRAGNDKVIIEVVPVKFVAPQEIIGFVQPFMSQNAQIVNPPGSNLLIVTETRANLKKVLKLIELIDVDSTLGGLEVFQIIFADAKEVATVIEKILNSKARALIQPQAQTRAPARGRGRARRGRRAAPATRGGGSGQSNIMIHPDERSNSLIVFGERRDIEFAREIIKIIDRDIYSASRTFIYYAEYAKAEDLAKLLNDVYRDSGRSGSSGGSPSASEQARTARQAVQQFTGRQTQAQGSAAATGADDGNLTGEYNIVADTRTNSLIIVASEADYRKILTLLKKLDIAPRQVLIEVLYAEINLDRDNQFGVNWSLLSQGAITLGGKTYGFDGVARQAIDVGDTGFVYNLFESNRFQATLQAISNDNKLKVLSNPHLVASNNLQAKIEIGDQIPIVTSRVSDNVNVNVDQFRQEVEYRDTGIILTITPSINENRFVTLEINQEISEVADRQSGGSSQINPTIQNRAIETTVVVQDNMSLVLGGLIRNLDVESTSGIPGLIRIPYFGKLFGNSIRRQQNVELLTVITPHVIISSQDATLATDSLWERSRSVTEFFEANKERFY